MESRTPRRSRGLSLIVVPQDAVQEVKLATSNYDAEYGKVAGGLWQVTTKSGTNAFHGSAFENYRTSGFNAADHFTEPKGIRPAIAGISLAAASAARSSKTKSFSLATTRGCEITFSHQATRPCRSMHLELGDFSSVAAIDPIYDPATGNPDGTGRTADPCNGVLNVICPDRHQHGREKPAGAVARTKFYRDIASNYQISRAATFDQNQFDTRVDYFVTSKTVVFGKFSYFQAYV